MEHFDLIRSYLDKKFIEQKQEFETKLQQQSIPKNIKVSAKPESLIQFKFKGNQIQFEFNQKLVEDLEDVIDLIKEGSVSRSTKRLAGIKLEITKRNKLIKMADRSPAGWATVEEYLSDELASDSDDEKRIKSAESKALAKKESKGKAKVLLPSTFQPYAHPTNVLVATYAKPFPITKIRISKRIISTVWEYGNHNTSYSSQSA
ncbi:uncharacterized protein LOC130627880 [Hydractinia symbiolongicarpus]|uniref:uncharacterized protein LOC130627880 n=1 Tax=Hydractinia symbiolongicarpus TaxID=13093 RepID=UPI00254A7C74|nr:uncharacterized protein LOC130627880 [Hydractinia symbiolongicarpus]